MIYLPHPQFVYQIPADVIPNPNNEQQIVLTKNGPGSAEFATAASGDTLELLTASPQPSSQISSNNISNSIAPTLKLTITTGS